MSETASRRRWTRSAGAAAAVAALVTAGTLAYAAARRSAFGESETRLVRFVQIAQKPQSCVAVIGANGVDDALEEVDDKVTTFDKPRIMPDDAQRVRVYAQADVGV